MNFWKTLGIKKTTEKSEIKKAYREKLKKTRPDEDEAGFIKLREAYEYALEYAENNYEEVYEDAFEEDYFDNYEDYEESEVFEPEIDEYTEWNIKLVELWGDLEKKYNPECWRELLYEGAPYKLKYYEAAREIIRNLTLNNRSQAFLPVEVYKVIDGFFSFSSSDESCIHMTSGSYQKWINEKTRISARVDIKKLYKDVNPDTVDYLLYRYKEAMEDMVSEDGIKGFDEIDLKYLPLETLKISLKFEGYSDEEFNDAVANLKCEYGDDLEIELLLAERMQFKGEDATKLIEELYHKLPKTDMAFTYRLMNCCKKAGLYYKGYMLCKHALWMFCTAGMNEAADVFCNLIEAAYKGMSDAEHIHMCRMYLRSNREKEALKILEKVKDRNTWEYHMASALAHFNENDITPGIESYEVLKAYEKDDLHFLQLLEWEELQARYYLEKKEYVKCLDKCREILSIYPESYPILILRSYADRLQYREYGNYEIIYDLWKLYKRLEVALLVASIEGGSCYWKNAMEALEDVKEKCELQYRYYKVRSIMEDSYETYKAEWLELLDFMASKDFYIDVKNKYGLLDFEEIFFRSSMVKYVVEEKKLYKAALTKIVESDKNNLGKEINKYLYYNLILDYKNAIPEAKRNLENANSKEERIGAMEALCDSYATAGMYNEMDAEISRFEEKYPEYKDDMINIYSRAVTLYRYEDEVEKAIQYAMKCKDVISIYTSEIYIDMLYSYYRLGSMDSSNYVKVIELSEEFFSIFGKYYVNGVNNSPYYILANSYAALGQVDKAIEALDFMREYSTTDYYKNMYYEYAIDTYLVAHQPQKAYDIYLEAVKNEKYTSRFSLIKIYMILGRYEDAFKILDDMATKDTDPDADLIMCAMNSKYFMDGYVDMEYLHKVKAEVERKIAMPGGKIGDNYFHMARIYMLLGNEEEAKKYYEMGMGYSEWNAPTTRVISRQLIALWTYWHRGEYEKAYEYCKNNLIVYFHFELVYLQYFLCEMYEKGRIDDFRNRFRNK